MQHMEGEAEAAEVAEHGEADTGNPVKRVDHIYRRESKMFQRFVQVSEDSIIGGPIYKSSPSFSVVPKYDPPIPGGITSTIDELVDILLCPFEPPLSVLQKAC
jgi:hypothetical protein